MMKDWLDFIFPHPHMCILCESEQPSLRVCESCLKKRRIFIEQEGQCQRCGSFGVRAKVCDNCRDWPSYYQYNMALLPYTDDVRTLVLNVKFHQEPWRLEGLQDLLMICERPDVDYLLPVPLHKKRLRERGYNQGLLLAKQLEARWQIPVLENVLERVRYTPHQAALPRSQRRGNVDKAFGVSDEALTLLKGKRVMLVDDVLTTGSTLLSCARSLHQAGVGSVCSLTLAAGIH